MSRSIHYCDCGEEIFDIMEKCPKCEREAHSSAPAGSGAWAPILVAAVVANCRRQIATLKMQMPVNVALALGRADEELADAEAWIRAERQNDSSSATAK